MNSDKRRVKKYEIYKADLDPVTGSEQGGVRPVLIVSNNDGNREGPTAIAACITKVRDKSKAKIGTHLYLGCNYGLLEESIVLFEQLRTIDKSRLKDKLGEIDDPFVCGKVDECLHICFNLE